MIFNHPPGKTPKTDKIYHNKKEIQRVKTLKYLGITLTQNLNFDVHVEKAKIKAKQAMGVAWRRVLSNRNIEEKIKKRIFESAIKTDSHLWRRNMGK